MSFSESFPITQSCGRSILGMSYSYVILMANIRFFEDIFIWTQSNK